ncbi:ORF6N domain-containing protein [Cytobacillus sp. IB215316]|uniref:ORF6N domain-containing protein n=1 Tax=Cytobacillus sp. IB215316 TaxID=3097354 RepID=UPI002A1499D3|nr:ORF6N domain-containing protein [Cytobacillus sp. IB215316]MDX8359803.1 ORF6C domain-containing protein [Cytobacillus sp. IB215316]
MIKSLIIEKNGQRLLTSEILAEQYGATIKMLNNNFANNQQRFLEDKHFILLAGNELRNFKREYENLGIAPNLNKLYLWTEKGAWLHAKSLNTDKAWEAYEMLVDDYYRVKQETKMLSAREQLLASVRLTLENSEKVDQLDNKIRQLEYKVDEQVTLDSGQQRRVQKAVGAKVYELTLDKGDRKELFRELHRDIKDRFGVASYRDLKRRELASAIKYIEAWIPKKKLAS